MAKKYWYAILLILFLVFAIINVIILINSKQASFLWLDFSIIYETLIIHTLKGLSLSIYLIIYYEDAIKPFTNVFFSWILIGFWLCFTLALLRRVKNNRQFNSPHNTSFFILGSLFIGIFYSFWGNYTGLLNWNLFYGFWGNYKGVINLFNEIILNLTPWAIIFGLPYLLYGSFLLYSCFKRYFVVHIGQKSYNSQKFGILCSFLIIFSEIIYLLILFSFINYNYFPLKLIYKSPDLMVPLLCIFSFIISVRYRSAPRQVVIPEVTTEVRTTPVERREPRVSTPSRSKPSTPKPTPIITTTLPPKPVPMATTRHQPRPVSNISHRVRPEVTHVERKAKKKSSEIPSAEREKPKPSKKFEKLLPSATALSVEDFKCIFCFKLPEETTSKKNGIILCPICKYPAHEYEFKDWLKRSELCSRCGAQIPDRFRRNPIVIPLNTYLKAFTYWKINKQRKK